jgi:hypothetical protein
MQDGVGKANWSRVKVRKHVHELTLPLSYILYYIYKNNREHRARSATKRLEIENNFGEFWSRK